MIIFIPPPLQRLPTEEGFKRRKEFLDRQIDLGEDFLASMMGALGGVTLTAILVLLEIILYNLFVGKFYILEWNPFVLWLIAMGTFLISYTAIYKFYRKLLRGNR